MKKNSCFLILILALSSFLFCKNPHNPEYQLFQLYYVNTSGENGVTTFDYNDEGILEKAIWELEDGSRASINFYRHDEKGNIIEKYREFSDSLISVQRFEFDDNGNMTARHFQRSDSITGKTTYKYDNHGKLLKAHCMGLNGWFYGELTYVYDNEGNQQKAIIEQKGKNTGVILYTYNENGLLAKEHWDFNGKWGQTFEYVYEKRRQGPVHYTGSNVFISQSDKFRVSKEQYDYAGKTGGPSYYYYANNKLVKKRFERSDNFHTETNYLYDHLGRLIRSYRQYSNGLCGIFTYEYNKNGKLIKRSFKRTDGVTGNEMYEYDENSRLIRAYWDNFDTWLSGTINFTCHDNGNLNKGHFKGKDGFDAEIDFSYDENQNLTKIVWNFTFGKTQTYIFDYEKL